MLRSPQICVSDSNLILGSPKDSPLFVSLMDLDAEFAAVHESESVLVFGRRQEEGSARSTDRRPKSAKARSRGKLGTGSAAGAMEI